MNAQFFPLLSLQTNFAYFNLLDQNFNMKKAIYKSCDKIKMYCSKIKTNMRKSQADSTGGNNI